MESCALCSSEKLELADTNVYDFEYSSSGPYTYFRCRQCGLININPVPTEEQLLAAYPTTYHAYHPQATLVARYMKNKYWRGKARRYSRYADKNTPILDVGCAAGDLLVELKMLGYKSLKGLDFNKEAVKKARSRGLDVEFGTIEDSESSNRRQHFQMIVMDNFIEHVYHPLNTLKISHSLLASGGVVVGETPNMDSWDYSLFRRYWGGYHTPRHLYLFNKNSLYALAERTGFHVKGIRSILQPAHWALSTQNMIQDTGLGSELRNGRAFYFTPLLLLFLPINLIQMAVSMTSLVEFIFQKE